VFATGTVYMSRELPIRLTPHAIDARAAVIHTLPVHRTGAPRRLAAPHAVALDAVAIIQRALFGVVVRAK
jgi:hypothetical protein